MRGLPPQWSTDALPWPNSPLDSVGPVIMLHVRRGGGFPADKPLAGCPCQVSVCVSLALASLNRLKYRGPAIDRQHHGPAMTSQIIPVAPFDFIIFGGTGDLSERKLLPALYHRQRDHQFSEPTRIIGASRSKLTDEDFRAFARKSIMDQVKSEYIDKAE